MKEWVLSVCGIIILTVILHVIMPAGKTGKIIKSIFSIMCLLVFIRPVLNFKNSDFSFQNVFNQSEVIYQNDFLDYYFSEKTKRAQLGCEEYIKEQCGKVCEVKIIYETDDQSNLIVKKVQIVTKNSVIADKNEHIDIIDKANDYLSEHFNVNKSLIEIYE